MYTITLLYTRKYDHSYIRKRTKQQSSNSSKSGDGSDSGRDNKSNGNNNIQKQFCGRRTLCMNFIAMSVQTQIILKQSFVWEEDLFETLISYTI